MDTDDDLKRIREALAAEKASLMALPEVQGVGIGGKPGERKIVVYLTSSKAPRGPRELRGFPVEYVVTGPIRPS